MENFNQILREGKIIDNTRVRILNMKQVLETIAKNSQGFKCAVGYFYIEGLVEIINSLKDLNEIKILMGYETTKPTKEQLIKAFKDKFDILEVDNTTTSAIRLFYQLIKEKKTLEVRVYFGEGNKPERLHSKAYLFLRNLSTSNLLDRYRAAIIGSSNLTPAGLVGNTELNVIITEPKDLEIVEKWFNQLWEKGSEDFEKLKISEAIVKALESSKFKNEVKNTFLYTEPREFFKNLIKYLNADYLFEEYKQSKLLQFQYIDFLRILNNFNSKGYKGCFMTSSVGLGKSYVASQVAKYFISHGKKVLIIAPAGLVHDKEQWPRYLKEFNIFEKVSLISMGKLQKHPESFTIEEYIENYGLIIVDEAHNFRNPLSYRTRNLKKIIDINGNAKILFLTATPINTRLEDLLNLINLFNRKGDNLHFNKLVNELSDLIYLFKNNEFENLSSNKKEDLSKIQEKIEKELFVKSTRETIKTSKSYINELKMFTGIDITSIPDPDIIEVKYDLDKNYKQIVNNIVSFITNLSAAHLRLLEPERGVRLGGFFKWLLYKRFESDISSYYLTLKRLYKKNKLIQLALDKQDIKHLEEDEEDSDIEINFNIEFKEKIKEIIDKLKSGTCDIQEIINDLRHDTKMIYQEIKKLESFIKEDSGIIFKKDKKIEKLLSIILMNKNKKILIFTEYKDTIRAIKEYLKSVFVEDEIKYIDSYTSNKSKIIKEFNDKSSKLRYLITTDALSEGYNLSGADIVINFDIPYNPVRIIQRIGRATRLDIPKKIEVYNFRPDNNIDVELRLVETLELRIKDIIQFIGVEYRIWFETEKELLSERKKRDKKIYLEVLNKIRNNFRKGNLGEMELSVNYSKPILSLLQKAIKKYNISEKELEKITLPNYNNYTLLKGKKGISFVYGDTEVFNENNLNEKELIEIDKKIDIQSYYREEIDTFLKYKRRIKLEETRLKYFNDKIDKLVNDILDLITANKLIELFPDINILKESLFQVSKKCGSTTEKILKKIRTEIKRNVTEQKIIRWIQELNYSFTKRDIQKTFEKKIDNIFAIAFIEE